MTPLLVRSWNLFHGNTVPPGREAPLRALVELASADRPDVLCLQEVPPWALGQLGRWSGMTALGEVAAPPRIGPLPSSAEVGRALTIHHGILRSAFTGQANAILLAPELRVLARDWIVLNARRFRRAQARWLGLAPVARLAWAKERRVCQAARVQREDGTTALVANLHATSFGADERLADAELLRAAVFADALARPGEPCILAGDLNLKAGRSWTLSDLTGPEWGFEGTGPWIDHVLVRGAGATPTERWPDERRRRAGRLLSDHAPVERRVE
ncbi:MAG: endonuclease/exonuclease/phosphatase family protein [Actinobacteria bacterium]|nr:endonuclease/exonuclease/phosphatase family protein [Actinomycetota bacterium]